MQSHRCETEERKRAQNRKAQRLYRQRMKERLIDLQAKVSAFEHHAANELGPGVERRRHSEPLQVEASPIPFDTHLCSPFGGQQNVPLQCVQSCTSESLDKLPWERDVPTAPDPMNLTATGKVQCGSLHSTILMTPSSGPLYGRKVDCFFSRKCAAYCRW